MERCPVCKARLKTDTFVVGDFSPICPRCGTELSMLQRIENQAESLCSEAIARLEAGDLSGAMQAVEQSIDFKPAPLAQALRGFIQHKSMPLS